MSSARSFGRSATHAMVLMSSAGSPAPARRSPLASSKKPALAEIRSGDGAAALAGLRRRGRVQRRRDSDETRALMVAAWREGHRRTVEDGPAVMLARRNRDVAELNALARDALRADGELGPD